jgi:hypothetical protein
MSVEVKILLTCDCVTGSHAVNKLHHRGALKNIINEN